MRALRLALAGLLIFAGPAPSAAEDARLDISEATLNELVREVGVLSNGGVYRHYSVIEGLGIDVCEPLGELGCDPILEGPAVEIGPIVEAGGAVPGLSGGDPPPPEIEGPGRTGLGEPPGATAGPGAPGEPPPQSPRPPQSPDSPRGRVIEHVELAACHIEGGGTMILPALESVAYQWWVMGGHFRVESGSMHFTATVRMRVDGEWYEETRTVGAALDLDSQTSELYVRLEPFRFEPPKGPSVDVAKIYRLSVPVAMPQEHPLRVPMLDGSVKELRPGVSRVTPRYLPGHVEVALDLRF